MKKTITLSFTKYVIGALAVSAFVPTHAATVIHDESFLTGTWAVSVLGGTNVTGASLTRLAGAGVTGDAQRTTITGSGSYTFDVQQFKTDRVWTPILDGEITGLAWEVWYRVTGASEFAGFRLAAHQGNSTYLAGNTYFEPALFSSNWQRATGSVLPTDFGRASGTGPSTLDFSAGAPSIQFGYELSRGVFQAGNTNYQASFYTLTIDAKPTPEPGSAMLLAIGLVVLGCVRRRPASHFR